jgi:hypothetical protein
MAANEAKAVPPVVSSVQDIPLENIRESSSNPRRVFDQVRLRELAANIQLHGVLQAILVRPSQDGAKGVYQLVAGARRFRASSGCFEDHSGRHRGVIGQEKRPQGPIPQSAKTMQGKRLNARCGCDSFWPT